MLLYYFCRNKAIFKMSTGSMKYIASTGNVEKKEERKYTCIVNSYGLYNHSKMFINTLLFSRKL